MPLSFQQLDAMLAKGHELNPEYSIGLLVEHKEQLILLTTFNSILALTDYDLVGMVCLKPEDEQYRVRYYAETDENINKVRHFLEEQKLLATSS